MARIACLRVANLPLAARLRAEPELCARPLVIVANAGPRAELIAVSPQAARAGVRVRDSLVHARAVCTDFQLRVTSAALERTAREALLDVAFSASPRAELAPTHAGAYQAEAAVYLDASGIGPLFGSEQALASILLHRAQKLGLPATVGIAASRPVAHTVGRLLEPGSISVIPPGREAEFLAPLPVDLLDPEAELAQALSRFGIERIGELLRIPEAALTTRLGPAIRPLLALARGQCDAPPPPTRNAQRWSEAIDLEFAIDQLEPLGFVLRGLLSRLVERLRVRGLACGDLDLLLELEGGGRDARRIGVAAPTQAERILLRLVQLALESRPPRAPVVTVSIATNGARARSDQLDLFRPAGPSPAELAHTLAELEAICGTDRVGTPSVPDTYSPGSYDIQPFPGQPRFPNAEASKVLNASAQPSELRSSSALAARARGALAGEVPSLPLRDGQADRFKSSELRSPSAHCARPRGACTQNNPRFNTTESKLTVVPTLTLRAVRPGVEAEVSAAQGIPVWVRSRLAFGRVVQLAGPWRTSGGWWSREEHFAYDHFDVETSDGAIIRLRFDRQTRCWQIDGLYD